MQLAYVALQIYEMFLTSAILFRSTFIVAVELFQFKVIASIVAVGADFRVLEALAVAVDSLVVIVGT